MDILRDENFWVCLPLIAWIGVIFYFSSARGSIRRTARFFIPALAFLFPQGDAPALEKYHLVVRKLCHLAGYAILGVFASLFFYHLLVPAAANFWQVWAFVLVLSIAALDEIRQSFYPSRHGSIRDVILDGAGGLTGILLFLIFA
mgnify:CR=1 FL=1